MVKHVWACAIVGAGIELALASVAVRAGGLRPAPAAVSPQDNLTYHHDTSRLGWYANETTLTSRSGGAEHRLFGTIVSTRGVLVTLQLRDGHWVTVDATPALAHNRVAKPLYRGKPTMVSGSFAAGGTFEATALSSAARQAASWGRDR